MELIRIFKKKHSKKMFTFFQKTTLYKWEDILLNKALFKFVMKEALPMDWVLCVLTHK